MTGPLQTGPALSAGAALRNAVCPLCQRPNNCAAAACGRLDVECWCSKVKIPDSTLARIADADQRQSCICADCAAGKKIIPPADGPNS